jgi:hypothetical protein
MTDCVRTVESLSVWYILLLIFRHKRQYMFSSNTYNKKWTKLQIFLKIYNNMRHTINNYK